MQDIHLNGHQQKILGSIFHHPIAHNLEWHDVLALLGHIGTVSERSSGEFDVNVGGEHAIIVRSRGKDITPDELRHLQKFLERAGLGSAPAGQGDIADRSIESTVVQYVVAIDHHEARLFLVGFDGGDPGEPLVLAPKDPHGFLRHLEHRKEANYQGDRVPEDHEYYGQVSEALKSATGLVVLTDGTGKSSAGRYFAEYLKSHHAGLADHLLATVNVDLAHITNAEIVETGRRHLSKVVQ